MILFLDSADGTIRALEPNPAVSASVLKEIWDLKKEGWLDCDIITILRKRTVPDGYSIHSWIPGIHCQCKTKLNPLLGRTETEVDQLRSILAQLEYCMIVREWDKNGVPFCKHLYVPEKHPITGVEFCEMEDEGHVFKVSTVDQCKSFLHVFRGLAHA